MRFSYLLFLALAGCPPPMKYVVADVTSPQAPVEGALVAADCGNERTDAMRADEYGRVRMALPGRVDASHCTLTVAKPGFATLETPPGSINMCTAPNACPPTPVRLLESSMWLAPAPRSRTYSNAPGAEIAR
jgi:hypothetical protein